MMDPVELEYGNTASLEPSDLSGQLERLLRVVVLTASVLMFLLAAVLLGRRVAGALIRPLDGATILLTGLLLAAAAATLRLTWKRVSADPSGTGRCWLVWTLPALALLAFAFALSLPDTPVWSLGLFWAILAVEEGVSLWLVWRGIDTEEPAAEEDDGLSLEEIGPPEMTAELTAVPEIHRPPQPGWSSVGDRDVRFDSPQQPSPHFVPPNVSQQLTRASEEDGSDVLYGQLRGHFAPGQRSLRLHVSFCPPFEAVPVVTVEKLEGPEISVKPAQVLAYGVRLDLRLKTLSVDAQDVILEIFVRGESQTSEF
jgi:hypothetical protein